MYDLIVCTTFVHERMKDWNERNERLYVHIFYVCT